MKPIKNKFILLFNPRPVETGRTSLSLGLLAISTYLVKEEYDIRIYNSSQKEYLEALDHLDKAICVGITSMTGYQIIEGLNLARLVREKNKGIPIVWGGVHPTIKPRQTIKHPLVDIVVRGQGEETFYELIKALESGSDLNGIPGITFKKDGKIIENISRTIKNINDFPLIPYHLMGDGIENFITRSGPWNRRLPIITSDGCPFNCGFCYLSTPEFKKKWDAYPPERVVNEIEYLVNKYKLNEIDVRDANFFIDKNRAGKIFQGIIEKKIKVSLINVNGRVDQLAGFDDNYWQLMKSAGVKQLLVGAESGDQEMLHLINKGITIETTMECERRAAKHKIDINNSMLTNFPPTTNDPILAKKVSKRELNNTIELIRKLYAINPTTNILLFSYTPYPGTPLYELCTKQGFKDPINLEEWGKMNLNTNTIPWVTQEQLDKVEFLNDLFILKKIVSFKYFKEKKYKNFKHYFLAYSGLSYLLNCWISFRLKYKIFAFPFEKKLFSMSVRSYSKLKHYANLNPLFKLRNHKRSINC